MSCISHYMDDIHVPGFDDELSALIKPGFNLSYFGTLSVAIENNDGEVYRVLLLEGLDAYVTLCHLLEDRGFKSRHSNIFDGAVGRYDRRFFKP
ncbi:hypothetical protein ACEK07_47945 [Alcanivoracaceae bacterium MT1]